MENLDIIKILGFGLSGLSFLFFVLSFRLISQEQNKPEPRKLIIQCIFVFMGLTLASTITVGWFGIVQNKTQALTASNDSLLKKQNELIAKYVDFINAQNQKRNANIESASDKEQVVKQVAGITTNTDTLAKTISEISPDKAKDINAGKDSIKKLLTAIKATPADDTLRIKTLSNRVISTNNRLQNLSKTALRANRNMVYKKSE